MQIYRFSAQLLKNRWLFRTTAECKCINFPLNYFKDGGDVELHPVLTISQDNGFVSSA